MPYIGMGSRGTWQVPPPPQPKCASYAVYGGVISNLANVTDMPGLHCDAFSAASQ